MSSHVVRGGATLWERARDRLAMPIVQRVMSAALHPHTGWVWQQDQIGGVMLRAAYTRGWNDAEAYVMGEDTSMIVRPTVVGTV